MAVERLAEEAGRASPLGTLAEPGFRITSDKNDRQIKMTCRQFVLQFQAAHSWHQHVGNQAGGVFQSWISQKFFGARKRQCLVTKGPNKINQRNTDGSVIVDDGDDRNSGQGIPPTGSEPPDEYGLAALDL